MLFALISQSDLFFIYIYIFSTRSKYGIHSIQIHFPKAQLAWLKIFSFIFFFFRKRFIFRVYVYYEIYLSQTVVTFVTSEKNLNV